MTVEVNGYTPQEHDSSHDEKTGIQSAVESLRAQTATIIKFKKRVPIEIELDMDALTWEDNMKFLALQEKLEKGEMDEVAGLEAVSDILSKLAGQDVRKMPVAVVMDLLAQFQSLMGAQADDVKNLSGTSTATSGLEVPRPETT